MYVGGSVGGLFLRPVGRVFITALLRLFDYGSWLPFLVSAVCDTPPLVFFRTCVFFFPRGDFFHRADIRTNPTQIRLPIHVKVATCQKKQNDWYYSKGPSKNGKRVRDPQTAKKWPM